MIIKEVIVPNSGGSYTVDIAVDGTYDYIFRGNSTVLTANYEIKVPSNAPIGSTYRINWLGDVDANGFGIYINGISIRPLSSEYGAVNYLFFIVKVDSGSTWMLYQSMSLDSIITTPKITAPTGGTHYIDGELLDAISVSGASTLVSDLNIVTINTPKEGDKLSVYFTDPITTGVFNLNVLGYTVPSDMAALGNFGVFGVYENSAWRTITTIGNIPAQDPIYSDYKSVTADINAVAGEFYRVDASSNDINIFLPDPSNGGRISIVKTDTSSNVVVVHPYSTGTISGYNKINLYKPQSRLVVESDKTTWLI